MTPTPTPRGLTCRVCYGLGWIYALMPAGDLSEPPKEECPGCAGTGVIAGTEILTARAA
jgi:hypothetical protein